MRLRWRFMQNSNVSRSPTSPIAQTIGIGKGVEKRALANTLHCRLLMALSGGSIEVSEVIHNLQTERDLTAFYLSSFSPVTKSDLVERYLMTNEALAVLSNWPVGGEEMRTEFKTKENFMIVINQYRHELGVYEYVHNMSGQSFIIYTVILCALRFLVVCLSTCPRF